MSTIHDQAMNYVYQQVLQRLLSFFSRAERTALQLLIQRLMVAAGGAERMGDYKVLVSPPVLATAAIPWRCCVPLN